jgi:hypothetical protein
MGKRCECGAWVEAAYATHERGVRHIINIQRAEGQFRAGDLGSGAEGVARAWPRELRRRGVSTVAPGARLGWWLRAPAGLTVEAILNECRAAGAIARPRQDLATAVEEWWAAHPELRAEVPVEAQ